MAYYVDTSALAKLVVAEPETAALRAWIADGPKLVAGDLVRTELMRVVRRRPGASAAGP
ncbi:MAG: PIN domain-containing protein [Acidimicrobiales bacterium]